MEAININSKCMPSTPKNSENMNKDIKGFSKVLEGIMREELEEESDIEETLAYLVDQPILKLSRVEYYENTDISSREDLNIEDVYLDKSSGKNNSLGKLIENNLGGIFGKTQLTSNGSLKDEDLIAFKDQVDLESKNIKAFPNEQDKENTEKIINVENTRNIADLDKMIGREKIEVLAREEFLGEVEAENLNNIKTDGNNSLNLKKDNLNLKDNNLNSKTLMPKENLDVERILNLEIPREDTLKSKPEDTSIELKKGQVKLDELESLSLKDMENAFRKIEIKDINSKDMESPKLSRENIEVFKDSIVKLIETKDIDGTRTMNVKLIPRALGSIDISLNMEDGKLVAKLMFENEQTRQLFSNNMKNLNQSLQRQDITIEDIQMDLNLNGQNGSSEGGKNNQTPFKDRDISFEDVDIKDDIVENTSARRHEIVDGAVSILV